MTMTNFASYLPLLSPHLHADAHGVTEVDHHEGDDGEPLLLGEGRHGEDQAVGDTFPVLLFSIWSIFAYLIQISD